jgi:ribosomal protein S6
MNTELEAARRYEIGFLVVPTVGDDNVATIAGQVREAIEKAGGTVQTEELPKFRRLAYEMRKKIDTKYERYTTAYFGYIHFEGQPEVVEALKGAVDLLVPVLRYIVTKDPVVDRLTDASAEAEEEQTPATEAAIVDEAPVASDEDLDRSIDKAVEGESEETVKE